MCHTHHHPMGLGALKACMPCRPCVHAPSPMCACPAAHVCMPCRPCVHAPPPMCACPAAHVCMHASGTIDRIMAAPACASRQGSDTAPLTLPMPARRFPSCPPQVGPVPAPHFPGRRDEGWWLVVGEPKANTLLAIKRVNLAKAVRRMTQSGTALPGGGWGAVEGCLLGGWMDVGGGGGPRFSRRDVRGGATAGVQAAKAYCQAQSPASHV